MWEIIEWGRAMMNDGQTVTKHRSVLFLAALYQHLFEHSELIINTVILIHISSLLPFPSMIKKNHMQFPRTLTLVIPATPPPTAVPLGLTARSRTRSPMRHQGVPASLVSMEMDSPAYVSWSSWTPVAIRLNCCVSVVVSSIQVE